jgi:heme-degrading monooxygenase HmoA
MFRRDIVPLLRQQRGFAGTSMLVDPDTGATQFVTYWRTLSDLARLAESRFFDAQVAKLARLFVMKPEVRILDVCTFEGYDASAASASSGTVQRLAEGDR